MIWGGGVFPTIFGETNPPDEYLVVSSVGQDILGPWLYCLFIEGWIQHSQFSNPTRPPKHELAGMDVFLFWRVQDFFSYLRKQATNDDIKRSTNIELQWFSFDGSFTNKLQVLVL